jgi:hypothetical protein
VLLAEIADAGSVTSVTLGLARKTMTRRTPS